MPSQNQGYREQKLKQVTHLMLKKIQAKTMWLFKIKLLIVRMVRVIRTNQQEKHVKPVQSWINFNTQWNFPKEPSGASS